MPKSDHEKKAPTTKSMIPKNHRIENFHKTIAISAVLSPWEQKLVRITDKNSDL
jgi:hypothetical protein